MADTIMNKVKEVNALLLEGEPENISVDTYGGYSGYKPQYILDALNAVFGIGVWAFEEISSEIVSVQTKEGTSTLAIAQVRVMIVDVPFQPTGWGQARVTKGDVGDARKGAQTDAIKKCLSYFSIGNRAYQGLLPMDKSNNNKGTKPATNGNTQRPTQQPAKPAIPPVQPTQAAHTPETAQTGENKKAAQKFDEIPQVSKLKAWASQEPKMSWPAILRKMECDGIAEDAISPEKCIAIHKLIRDYKASKKGGEQAA